jgi:hypothetical protein
MSPVFPVAFADANAASMPPATLVLGPLDRLGTLVLGTLHKVGTLGLGPLHKLRGVGGATETWRGVGGRALGESRGELGPTEGHLGRAVNCGIDTQLFLRDAIPGIIGGAPHNDTLRRLVTDSWRWGRRTAAIVL